MMVLQLITEFVQTFPQNHHLMFASAAFAVPVLLFFSLTPVWRRFKGNFMSLYWFMFPEWLRRMPMASAFLVFWIWLGGVLFYTRLWTLLWPQDLSGHSRSNVRFYVGGVMIVAGFLMLFGKAMRRRWPLAIGSALNFGISGIFLGRLLWIWHTGEVLWPEVLFAVAMWSVITVGFLVSLFENKRVVVGSERAA